MADRGPTGSESRSRRRVVGSSSSSKAENGFGLSPSALAGGPYCYFRINLKAKKVLTDRYTNLWFHQISSCALAQGGTCRYALATPPLACAPNPDQDTSDIAKNEDIVIPIHVYVP